jgi:hypothetical protein
MALAHNLLLRGLNSIYLQAQHIVKADEIPFCKYILGWHLVVHHHHASEEEDFFPAIEQAVGEEVMAANLEQHRAFYAGMEAFVAYVQDCKAGKQMYDGDRIVALIDDFGKILADHLADEIPSIRDLKRFGAVKTRRFPEIMVEMGENGMVNRPDSYLRPTTDSWRPEIYEPYRRPPVGLCEY